MIGQRTPHLNVHGSFSFNLNFYLLKRFAEVMYSAQVMQTAFNDGFKCSATFLYLDSTPQVPPQPLLTRGGECQTANSNFLKFQTVGSLFPRFDPDLNKRFCFPDLA